MMGTVLRKAATTGPAGPAETFFGGRVRLIGLSPRRDHRGVLIPFDFDRMPFVASRAFVVTDVPAGTVRGGHAHRSMLQLLVCVKGRVEALLRHGGDEKSIVLDETKSGLIIEPGVWSSQTYLDAGTVLLVFASEPYDPASYIDLES
jgi:dTDP-4-dehydrorhamnose 3,5-epimerase-like enzyme